MEKKDVNTSKQTNEGQGRKPWFKKGKKRFSNKNQTQNQQAQQPQSQDSGNSSSIVSQKPTIANDTASKKTRNTQQRSQNFGPSTVYQEKDIQNISQFQQVDNNIQRRTVMHPNVVNASKKSRYISKVHNEPVPLSQKLDFLRSEEGLDYDFIEDSCEAVEQQFSVSLVNPKLTENIYKYYVENTEQADTFLFPDWYKTGVETVEYSKICTAAAQQIATAQTVESRDKLLWLSKLMDITINVQSTTTDGLYIPGSFPAKEGVVQNASPEYLAYFWLKESMRVLPPNQKLKLQLGNIPGIDVTQKPLFRHFICYDYMAFQLTRRYLDLRANSTIDTLPPPLDIVMHNRGNQVWFDQNVSHRPHNDPVKIVIELLWRIPFISTDADLILAVQQINLISADHVAVVEPFNLGNFVTNFNLLQQIYQRWDTQTEKIIHLEPFLPYPEGRICQLLGTKNARIQSEGLVNDTECYLYKAFEPTEHVLTFTTFKLKLTPQDVEKFTNWGQKDYEI